MDAKGLSLGKRGPSGVCPKWELSVAGKDLPFAQMSAGLGGDPAGSGHQEQGGMLPGSTQG